MIRPLFSARAAEPRVLQALEAIVKAAIAMGRADGQFSQAELEALVDAVRDVAAAAVGPDRVQQVAPTPRLMDWARQGVHQLRTEGRDALVAQVASLLSGDFRRHALGVAVRVIAADGVMTEKELDAFRHLARAVHLQEAEQDLLETLARAGRRGIVRDDDVEAVRSLLRRGWTQARPGAPGAPAWYDVWATYRGPQASLRVELDAPERVLHLHVESPDAAPVHALFAYGLSLAPLVDAIDADRDGVTPATVHSHLARWVAQAPDTFVEADGVLRRVSASLP